MNELFRFNAIACELAKSIYWARALAQEVVAKDWEALSGGMRQRFVDEAAEILTKKRLMDAQPSPLLTAFADLTRTHAGRVIGHINEQTPWGEVTHDQI